MSIFTFYEKRLLVVDVHEAVGTGVAVASERVPYQLLPGRLGNGDVVVLHPATLMWVVDVSPVVACIGLAFVNKHGVEPVWNLGPRKRDLGCGLTNRQTLIRPWAFRDGASLTCIMDLSEYMSSMVLWILFMLPCRSGWKKNYTKSISKAPFAALMWHRQFALKEAGTIDQPRVSFSTSLLQRCRQPSSTLSSSSVMWRGAGCMGRSGGSRDWVKGLWMSTRCCWAAVAAVVGSEAGPELSKGGKGSCSAVLQG